MATAAESVAIEAPRAEVWGIYFDPGRWAAWADGFARVVRSEGYPEVGGTLVWESVPAGRGRVTERVVEHAPDQRHRTEFDDPEMSGRLTATFAPEPGAMGTTRVTVELDYRLKHGGLLTRLADPLFIRGQLRGSMARSLERLKREAELAA